MTRQIAFIIPDWRDKIAAPAYINIAAAFRASGYDLIEHNVAWMSGSVEGWASSLANAIRSHTGSEITVYGIGLGGMIALVAATKVPIDRLILCSPKGYFSEYVRRPEFVVARWIGDARLEEFSHLSAIETLASQHVGRGKLIIDQAEIIGKPLHKQWIEDLTKNTHWEVEKLPYQPYGIKGPAYQKAIIDTVRGDARGIDIESNNERK